MSGVTRVVGVVGCGLALAGCGNLMPSLDFKGAFSATPTSGTLSIQSEPPGAEARASTGPSCTTPCSLEVPGTGDFTVSLALAGYKPQTVTVKALPGESNAFSMTAPAAHYDPATVMAQLEPLAPPPKTKHRSAPKPAKTSATTRPDAAPAAAAAQ